MHRLRTEGPAQSGNPSPHHNRSAGPTRPGPFELTKPLTGRPGSPRRVLSGRADGGLSFFPGILVNHTATGIELEALKRPFTAGHSAGLGGLGLVRLISPELPGMQTARPLGGPN